MTHGGHLLVLWREPTDDGSRHVVGHLRDSSGQYSFEYVSDLDSAKAKGFQLFLEFPVERDVYTSRYLFPSFSQRVPSPARPDFARLIASWGVVNADDKMEILAKSGGLQLTDRIELAEFRDDDDALARPLEFRVAGARHRDPAPTLDVGMAVTLRAEPENAADPFAVRVEDPSGAFAGYVPRQYSRLVSRWIGERMKLRTRVVRLLVEPGSAAGRAVVVIER